MPYTIQINDRSSTPKYRQIANSIIRGIESKIIGREEQLPSINELSSAYDISRDTAEKAYRLLKKQGIVRSVRGKGYYTSSDSIATDRKILLVFNKLSLYKEAIYNGFVKTINQKAWVDLQIYYEDYSLFERILKEKSGKFTEYVIIPSFKGEEAIKAQQAIDQHLVGQKILLLNSTLPNLQEQYGAVFQNYEIDIYQALLKVHHKLSKYQQIKMYFPFQSNYSRGIIHGFQKYCLEKKINSDIIFKNYDQEKLHAGTAYILINDHQLVTLVNKIKHNKLTLGEQIGILAYNDSPLKQVLLDGITVMTTNHDKMGSIAANMIINNDWKKIENEFHLIERGSL